MSKIVIIGGGECGARAAFTLREMGFDGDITMIGAEPHLPYERPPLSKSGLAGSEPPRYVAGPERYEEAKINILVGVPAEAIDRRAKLVRLSDGRTLPYDQLLLATGARPRSFPGLSDPRSGRIRMLRSHGDSVAIREALAPGKRLAVIGGGFIGLEIAATARNLGAEVVLLESSSRVLSRGVPAEIAEVVAERHRQEGVKIICGEQITSVVDGNDEARILLANGTTVRADLVVVGIGAVPNAELAEAAGLLIDNGIAVDVTLRTSDPDIFAAGDCCSFPLSHYRDRRVRLEAWRNALDQGTTAAANLLGRCEGFAGVPWFWSDQYELTLQIAGLFDDAATTVRRDLDESAFILFHLDGDDRLIAASGIGRGNIVARDIRLAEMLIAARGRLDPAALASSKTNLKKLLAA